MPGKDATDQQTRQAAERLNLVYKHVPLMGQVEASLDTISALLDVIRSDWEMVGGSPVRAFPDTDREIANLGRKLERISLFLEFHRTAALAWKR